MNLVEQVRLAGVVGAGGGGFPTHVKLAGKADTDYVTAEYLEELHAEMLQAAQELDFERAAELREELSGRARSASSVERERVARAV